MPWPDLSGATSAIDRWAESARLKMAALPDRISAAAFRSWALQEAAIAADVFIPVYQTFTNISPLTGPMLKMYLRGTDPDPELMKKVAAEVLLSATFARLGSVLKAELAAEAAKHDAPLSLAQVEGVARRTINLRYRDPKTGRALYFDNSDRGLQGVIGGVTDLRVEGVELTGRRWTVRVVLGDIYDFDNTQLVPTQSSHLGEYVKFRTRLAHLLKTRSYRQYLAEYHGALYTGSPVIRSRAFAAHMYAIERNGLTPGGVAWSVVVPVRGELPAGKR